MEVRGDLTANNLGQTISTSANGHSQDLNLAAHYSKVSTPYCTNMEDKFRVQFSPLYSLLLDFILIMIVYKVDRYSR